MNKTANFQLTQWEKTDRIMMEDFNRDNAAIDAALKSNADKAAALQTALASCGNCKIVAKTYVGTGQNGQDHPNTLTFDSQPLFVIIGTYETRNLYLLSGCKSANLTFSSSEVGISVSWNGNQVSWYASQNAAVQFNVNNVTYHVVAFLAAK